MRAASGDLPSFTFSQPFMWAMSTGPNQSATASTLLEASRQLPTFPSMSTVVLPTVRSFMPLVTPASEARCPPDENPVMPTNEVSRRYSSAWARTKRMAAFTSLICAGNLASPLERWLMHTTAKPASVSGLPSDI